MVNKNLLRIAFLLGMIFCLFSCGNLDNPKERNKLVFEYNIISLTDSINAMNKLLLKSKNGQFTYGIDVDMNNGDRNNNEFFLYICDDNEHSVKNAGIITDSSLYKSKLLEFIDSTERKRFVNLALFLNRNHLSGCNIENEKVIYLYRANIYMADRQTDLDRLVVFSNSEQEINLNRYKILDKHRNLYLLADKEAKIWSSE
jgi:hypothetical protein